WSALLSAFRNEAGEAIELSRGDTRDFTAEKRGYDFFCGAVEKCFDKMAKRGAAGDVARHGGNVDVAEALLFVADVSFFFERAKLGAGRGVDGFVGESREDGARRRWLR